jgi:hypothetical protein
MLKEENPMTPLTVKEYEQLDNRAKDELVAIHVMKYKKIINGEPLGDPLLGGVYVDYWQNENGASFYRLVRYNEDWEAMRQVVEKIKPIVWEIEMSYGSDCDKYLVSISLSKDKLKCVYELNKSLPAAVALAALRIAGVLK